MKIYRHRCQLEEGLSNEKYDWISSDTKEIFDNIKNTYPNDESVKYYLNNPITYKLNNFGFRTPDDFNINNEGNVFIGCSHTFGVGLPLEHTWSYKLNQIIGGKFWNLGVGGSGITTHFRLLLAYHKEFKIKNIFHFAPFYARYEYIINNVPTVFNMNHYDVSWRKQFGMLCEESLINNDQRRFMFDSITYAIKGLAAEIGVNYYYTEWQPEWKNLDWDGSLRARDFMHFSVGKQHKIYQHFLKMYDETLYEKYKDYSNFLKPNDINIYENFGEIKNSKTLL
jgi:hypothetical protein